MRNESPPALPAVDHGRRHALGLAAVTAGGLLAPALAATAAPAQAAEGPKVLRYAFRVAETGFDPPRLSDLYSRIITAHIFEPLFTYDYLARPAKVKPLTAAALPEMSADFKVFTIKLKPGIFFASDEAFAGKPRELVAQDYVYAFKRFADPATKAPAWGSLEEIQFLGLNELREQALSQRKAFDYEREIPGLRALDRYTLRMEVKEPQPRLAEALADGGIFGAVAREVVERYGEQIAAHPVGTGPFRLAQWRRSSLIVLERNPQFREMVYEAEPAPDDAEGQALWARYRGRRLPMIDRVEVSIIEENQPRWLSFLNQQHDFIERVPEEFIGIAMPGNRLAANLKHQGIQGYRTLYWDVCLTLYNMEDPVIGGYTPEKIALRRAMNLAVDVQRQIDLVRRGQGKPAQAMAVPYATGYDPAFKSEMSDYDPARARALLDLYGYLDKDGDGFREHPDGSPLVLIKNTQPDQFTRSLEELWLRDMKAIGLKGELLVKKWPENLKAAQAGKLMMWDVASSASQPDGQGALQRLYGPAAGGANLARFRHKAFDAVYDQLKVMPDGPEREALFRQAKRIAIAYAPYKNHVHRYVTDMAHPWVQGYRRPLFHNDFWQYVDVDNRLKKA